MRYWKIHPKDNAYWMILKAPNKSAETTVVCSSWANDTGTFDWPIENFEQDKDIEYNIKELTEEEAFLEMI